jgi:hypothetical protein
VPPCSKSIAAVLFAMPTTADDHGQIIKTPIDQALPSNSFAS